MLRHLTLTLLTLLLATASIRAESIAMGDLGSSWVEWSQRERGRRRLRVVSEDGGYQFSNPIEAISSKTEDGSTLLSIKKGSRFIVVEHPEYGAINWRIPRKRLHWWREYRVEVTPPPAAKYRATRGWLAIVCSPKEVIVEIDSTTLRSREGRIELLLPAGRYPLQSNAALYETLRDTVDIEASERLDYQLTLAPSYGYISIESELEGLTLRLDSREESRESMRRRRVSSGSHELYAVWCGMEMSEVLELAPLESLCVEITASQFEPLRETAPARQQEQQRGEWTVDSRQRRVELSPHEPQYGAINISSNAPNATVIINGKIEGLTPLIIEGLSTEVDYRIRLQCSGYKGAEEVVRLEPNSEKRVVLEMRKR